MKYENKQFQNSCIKNYIHELTSYHHDVLGLERITIYKDCIIREPIRQMVRKK